MSFSTLLDNLHPVWPLPVIVALVGGAALLTLLRAWRGKSLRPSWLQPLVVLLRWGALAVLALILLNPNTTITQPAQEGHALILLDGSASMNLHGLGSSEPTSRWREAVAWTEEFLKAQTTAGQTSASLAVFGADTQSISQADLMDHKPTATSTQLAASIASVVNGAPSQQLDHVIIVSDGAAHDKHQLTSALAAARGAGLIVSTKLVGLDDPPRNAALTSVVPPRMTRPRSRVNLPVEVQTTGVAASETLKLTLKDQDDQVVAQQNFTMPEAVAGDEKLPLRIERKLSFETAARTMKYHLELSGIASEVAMDDNQYEFTIEAVSSKLRVLLVEGTHVVRSVGNEGHVFNDIELMTKAWDATGEIEWEVLTPISEYLDRPNLVGVKQFVNGEMMLDKSKHFPKTRDEIFAYDVMMISDVPVGNFSKEQMQIVVDWITERGGGFLMGGGYTSFDVGHYDKTPWEKIIPVDMLEYGEGFFEHDFRIAIPESVRNHPIWQISPDQKLNLQILATHPMLAGMNRVRRAKPGALVLATRPEADNEPVFTAQNYGRGRSMAYLPDPNGGWAKYTVGWGPPGGPVQGRHTELGHGENFRFHEDVAGQARGPMPPHPAPYYGQFWVNVAKWLGENSIRWRRDKLSGKIIPTQAQAGHSIAVAAEVLAVSSPSALVALDVGARLSIPGSPRVRLEYNRDKREFLGQVMMPQDYSGTEVQVLFDCSAGNESFTDAVSTGVQVMNQEFLNSAPDATLLREVATAGGGKFITTTSEAIAANESANQAHAQRTQRQYHQPLWTNWWWWGSLLALLTIEWWLRRRGGAAKELQPMMNQ
jgi:uncharacterized membrane protein